MRRIKVLAMLLSAVTVFGHVSAFAEYPQGMERDNGDGTTTYIYGPWAPETQPAISVTGFPSKLCGRYDTGGEAGFKNKWYVDGYVQNYSNPEKRFVVDGKNFILLDKDIDGNYFVIADDLYGTKPFVLEIGTRTDTSSPWFQALLNGTWIYDPENTNNVAYWLNNDFLSSGNKGNKLPDGIISNLVEKEWGVEGGSAVKDSFFYKAAGLDAPEYTSIAPYKVTQKVSLLSATEYNTYWADISPLAYGIEPNTGGAWDYNHWMLRTSSNNEITADFGSQNSIYIDTKRGQLAGVNSYNAVGIRPCFWLEEDFFSEVVIDLDTAGENVINEIKTKYAKAELADIYSEDDLEGKLGYSEFAPLSAQKTNISGNFAVGETIVADYEYQYEEGTIFVPEGATKFQWYASEDGEEFEAISGENSKEYVITSSDLGKKLKVSIKCVDIDGNAAPIVFTDNTVSVRQAQEKSVSVISYSNFDGTEFDGTGIKVNFNVSSTQTGKVLFLIGMYDNENKLVGVEFEEKDIASGNNLISVDMEEFSGSVARIIAVEDETTYRPYLITEIVK